MIKTPTLPDIISIKQFSTDSRAITPNKLSSKRKQVQYAN